MGAWRRGPLGLGAAIVAALPWVVGCGPTSVPLNVAELGEPAPQFTLTDVDGGTFSLQEAVATKPLVFVFLPGCT